MRPDNQPPETADVALIIRKRLVGWTYAIQPITAGAAATGPYWRLSRTAAIAAGSLAAIACSPREPWVTVSAPMTEENQDLIPEIVETMRATAEQAQHTPNALHLSWPHPDIVPPYRAPLLARVLARITR